MSAPLEESTGSTSPSAQPTPETRNAGPDPTSPDPSSPDPSSPHVTAPQVRSAPVASPDEEAAGRQTRLGPTARQSRGLADMVRSVAVVVGMVLLLVILVPRPNAINQPPVDVVSAASAARTRLGFVPAVPHGLGAGWLPTAAEVNVSTDDVLTWHVGYRTPSGAFAAVEQARTPSNEWLAVQTSRGRVGGTYLVGGRTWQLRERLDRQHQSLVLPVGDVTTLVTGTAAFPELAELASAAGVGQ